MITTNSVFRAEGYGNSDFQNISIMTQVKHELYNKLIECFQRFFKTVEAHLQAYQMIQQFIHSDFGTTEYFSYVYQRCGQSVLFATFQSLNIA